ncbi:MAG: aminopeptidase P family N-terminal domain-containing protein, partial [Anaerolineales bacterium]
MDSTRLEKLQIALVQAGLDAVVINPGPILTYLTGLKFHLMERPVVLLVARGKDPVIVLPELESPKVNLFPYKVNAFTYGENPSEWDAVFRKAIQSLGLDGKKIGVEPRQLRLLEFQYMRGGAPEADFPDASEALASLRLRKDDSEVDAMKQAVKVAQVAL